MALDVKVISFNIGTGAVGTTVTVTPGFQAKAGILQWSGRTESTDTNGGQTHLSGIGMFGVDVVDGDIEMGVVATRSTDGIGTSECDSGHDFGEIIAQKGNGSFFDGTATIQSISSTQVVFEITDQFTVDLRVTGIFFGGDDVDAKLQVVNVASGTPPFDQEVSLPLVPKAIFTLTSNSALNAPQHTSDVSLNFGVGVSLTKQFGYGGSANENSPTQISESYLRTGDLVVSYATNLASIPDRATLKSMTVASGDGFTMTWEARSRALRIYTLALGGTFSVDSGSFQTQTDTTTDMTGTTSFTPKGLLFVSHNKVENSAGGLSPHHKLSIGMATGTSEQHCQAMADQDNTSTMHVSTALEQDHIYVNMDEANETLQGSANLTAVSSSGFTARMTDADPSSSRVVCWLAVGDAAAAETDVAGDLDLAALVLSASAAVSRTVSGALVMSPSVVAASASVARTASGAASLAPVTLSASTNIPRDVAAALNLPAAVVDADLSVTRMASAALTLSPATLAASASILRSVSGALNVPVAVLASNVTVMRTVMAAVTLSPVTLAAAATLLKTVAAALDLPASTLAADVDVARTVATAIALSPLTLAAIAAGGKSVFGSVLVSGPVLAASAAIDRTVSGAAIVPALTLAASATRTVNTSGAMLVPASLLNASVSVVRFANGALGLVVPVLDANVMGQELTATATLTTAPLVIDADLLVTRTASGALVVQAPVLAADLDVIVNVQGVLVLEAPTLEAQVAIQRFVSGDLTLPEAVLAAQSVVGAIQSVIGLTASVVDGSRLSTTVSAIRDASASVRSIKKSGTVH